MALVLDTSAYIGIISGDKRLSTHIALADSIMVPSVVIGELYYGFNKGKQYEDNVKILDKFLDTKRVSIVPIDSKVAEHYGRLKYVQYSTGQILAENDLWIAAVCLYLELPLLTFDSDFSRIADKSFDLLPV